ATFGYTGGRAYRMAVKTPQKVETSDTELKGQAGRKDLLGLGNISVQARAHTVSLGDGVHGLMCHRAGPTGPHHRGAGARDGVPGLFKYAGTAPQTLHKSESPADAGDALQLRLDCAGGTGGKPATLDLYVNGHKAEHFVDTHGPLGPGRAGLAVATNANAPVEVLFDDFEVRHLA